ncbi:FAD/FMN-containing dehydrogenase [Pseudomonas flavescens]|uniref:FAD/FMN-containing dehydrogenase n=1 Tax=Phytopseudomonas flavescens TaxID=29435 RepID=A0A1G8ICS7_9GAMM|nr:FAD-binding oxidoreductase [Pseudomonas flavescens]SDI16779.1 FAD/FMN-containing dehydrogenase [Pseudomonas flavescens]
MKPLGSWGRYPYFAQQPLPCHWRQQVIEQGLAWRDCPAAGLPYGNGRSYGDSCLASSDQVLYMRPLARFVAADWQQGLVTVEAGMTLGELLQQSIARGWFLPVTPGTRLATVGGAIANDVHGKNHHVQGTFGRHVEALELVRSELGLLRCSPAENAELFNATVGGLGLTGIILTATLRLRRIASSKIRLQQVRFANLREYFAISRELDARHEYNVAWVDCLAPRAQLGRGVFLAGDHHDRAPCKPRPVTALRIPVTPPVPLFNSLTLKALNGLYFHSKGTRPERLQDYDAFFYPLDRLLDWNRIYGPRGFQQYQCVIPQAIAEDAMGALLATIQRHREGSFLAVLKNCGDLPSPGLLSFPLPGVSLALDFPQRGEGTHRLLRQLDQIVREAGGRLYPAKDAHMHGDDFRLAYPSWERLERLRDPALLSRFWQRVTQQ